CYQHSNGWTF
nr:immunoglobulin light chain junction region [Macaca mulatta]MOW74285.1 immunoglobulin light chain junction region [Macaca mulatta]